MLPRAKRLSGEQLEEVMKKGRVVHTPFFWLRLYKQLGPTKIAVVSPQKLVKKATGRVGFRRAMYSAIESFVDNVVDGHHVVVCMKEPLIKAEPSKIKDEMKEIFVKSGLLK